MRNRLIFWAFGTGVVEAARRTLMVGASLCWLASSAHAAIEAWADPALPVQNGLLVWLDAGRQAAARAGRGEALVPPASPLSIWYDGSGDRRDFLQRRGESQPRFITGEGRSVVRFDGENDYLELTGLKREVKAATVFVVVAPTTNLGSFRGILAADEQGRNDYTSGFTLDLGPLNSTRFDVLNVEGKGFSGFFNVLESPRGFGEFSTIQVNLTAEPAKVATLLNGVVQKSRERADESLRLDELTLGARYYSNEPRPAFVQGFLHGDVAEVLVYDRALTDPESVAVAAYLAEKHRGLTEAIQSIADRGDQNMLRTVKNPPPFQFLVPGFSVRELPLDLKNVNNVRRRPDGKIIALCYNGDVYILSDSDGDGLEDHAELFWDNQGRIRAPIGAALTPPGYHLGNGLFIASKGKCSLVVDVDGDDRADQEIIVAQGWPELVNNVDALGVTVGPDGSIYFGRGTHDFTNAYLLDRDGRSHYDLKDERGTVIKVSPDFKNREIIATGIRFPVALAFNHQGDLFATDQEGATWLPNGNPFDELLHIRGGRHYGFPPRHSSHLPDVVDEPSVVDYAPQHQSTCGLTFNGAPGEPIFGPHWWADDALVCGYSRGKLYRTKLVRVRGEYVGRTDLIGVSGMLLVDSCIAADGSLIVAAHGGAPDWGSGPEGKGKLFKLSYSEPALPQPTLAWSSGPREVRVAFDRPLDPEALHDISSKTVIESGPAVAPGDRFETLRPGYAVVAAQLAEPRRSLAVRGLGLTPDRRTLVLATDSQSAALPYALTLPGLGRPDAGPTEPKNGPLPQSPEVDLAFSLNGVEARWTAEGQGRSTTTWLPHLDLSVSRGLVERSAEHEGFWNDVETPGKLVLRAQLRLANLLRPAVQPGSVVTDRLPDETPTLIVLAREGTRIESPGARVETTVSGDGHVSLAVTFDAVSDRLIPIEIDVPTGPGAFLDVSFRTNEDARSRLLTPSRIFVPWASISETRSPAQHGPLFPPEFAGGDWHRGRAVFYGQTAQCARCHTIRGEGGRIGPDLSNLVERDFESVLRDVTQPNAAINPDFVAYNVALADGRILTGSVRTEKDQLHIGHTSGEETTVARSDVEELKPVEVSTMPEGLPALIGPDDMKHLLAFLLVDPPGPAPIHRDDAPPLRTRAEWESVLKAGAAPADAPATARPLRITLAAGPKDHGIDEHDYPLWLERWTRLLQSAQGVSVRAVSDGNGLDDTDQTDVLVWYSANGTWTEEAGRKLRAFLDRGGGLVGLHFGVYGAKEPDALADLIGLAWADGQSKFRHGPLDLTFAKDAKHPITAGFDMHHFVDESYWKLRGDPSHIEVLATGDEEGSAQPLMWVRHQGKGRVFCSIPGHYTWTFDDPLFRLLILRGICWTADQPVDRLLDLAPLGARLEDASK